MSPHTEDLKHWSAHAWVTLASWRRRALFSHWKGDWLTLGFVWKWTLRTTMDMFRGKMMSFTQGLSFSWNDDEPWFYYSPMELLFGGIPTIPSLIFSISLLSYSSWSTEDYIFKYASRMKQKLQDYRSLLESMCLHDISGKRLHGDVSRQWCWTGTKTRHFMTNQYFIILYVGISCLIWWYHMFTIR